VIEELLLLL